MLLTATYNTPGWSESAWRDKNFRTSARNSSSLIPCRHHQWLPPRTPRVTLADLASEAGVSLATASKVLNGRPDVAAATRERVEALLERNGYRRRIATATRSRLIELVFHELESAWSMELIRGVEDVASDHGMSVVLTESGTRHAPGPEWLEGVLSRRPVGVVLVFSDLPEQFRAVLAARSIPFVIVDPAGDPSPDVPAVGSANWAGGLAAVAAPHRAGPPPHRGHHRPGPT
jgi:LacI family xylobiose transport system transcriptional regulator